MSVGTSSVLSTVLRPNNAIPPLGETLLIMHFSAIGAMAEMCTGSHTNGEEGHLSPEASDQGLPLSETEPHTGKRLATENITIQEPLGAQCGESMGFKEKLLGK